MTTYLLGLTGSIGTGKSTTAHMLGHLKVPVHDADAQVHKLLSQDEGVIALVAARFPECVVLGCIDRLKLGKHVFEDPQALVSLEDILHPLVQKACRAFIAEHKAHGTPLAVLEIPLLFEKGYDALCDRVIVTTCAPNLQRARVLARPGMNEFKFTKILARQMHDDEKKCRADFILNTDASRLETFRKLRQILKQVCLEIKAREKHCS